MINDSSYKLSFIFAIAIHALLILFLIVKVTTSKHSVALGYAGSIINATAINERDLTGKKQLNRPSSPKQVQLPVQIPVPIKAPIQPVEKTPAPIKPQIPIKEVKKPKPEVKKEQLQTLLQKNLLAEQTKEIAELKKEQQKHKTAIVKQKQQQQMQKMLQDQIAAEQQELTESSEEVTEAGDGGSQGGQLQGGEVDKIKQAIASEWNVPEGAAGVDFCQVLIQLAPGGRVMDVQIVKSSGNVALERSAKAAVLKASPLPVPEDVGLFDKVRNIKLMFNPEGIVGN